jgi:N-acetylneuraminic acid mutarotase
MWRWFGMLALLGGCDKLFSLDQLDEIEVVVDAYQPDASGPTLDRWRAATPLPVGRDYNHSHAAFVGDTLFMIGGFDVSVGLETAKVYRATVTGGDLGAWTETMPLPAARALSDIVTIDQRMYVVGGANFGGAQPSVYIADATLAGDITSWSATTELPVALKAHGVVTANGYLYAIGGGDMNNIRRAEVYVAPVQANGSLGTWQATTSLPSPRANLCAITAGGYLYAIGGDDVTIQSTATVYVASLDPDTGSVGPWSVTTAMPAPRQGFSALTDGNHIYVIGGDTPAVGSQVLHSRIGTDGTLGPWETNEPLLVPHFRHSAAMANGLLFVLGGATSPTNVERSSQLVP